ncbi:MAG TPA: stage V sporulation protein S [Anaerolineales bacterium]|nr:stage V sporulation protein S [Anaerolineales bacterium]
MELIRVSATSPVSAVTGAIISVVLEYKQAEVQAIGADAANRAMQALDQAVCCLENNGIPVTSETRFSKVAVDHRTRTAVTLIVKQALRPGFDSMEVTRSAARAELPRV